MFVWMRWSARLVGLCDFLVGLRARQGRGGDRELREDADGWEGVKHVE